MQQTSTIKKTASAFGMNPNDALNDLRMSEKAMPLYEHVKRFVADTVAPMSLKFRALGEGRVGEARWQYAPGQLELLNAAKEQAKKEGLWNFFLPDADTGEGLSNLDYAFILAASDPCNRGRRLPCRGARHARVWPQQRARGYRGLQHLRQCRRHGSAGGSARRKAGGYHRP